MAKELELEYTFLMNELPNDLDVSTSKIIEDNFIPLSAEHPITRIRRNGDEYMITKKYPIDSVDGGLHGDSSRQIEHTIPLSREEYDALNSCGGKKFKKRRFLYEVDGVEAEIDVYLDKLAGLVVIDFEFDSDEEMNKFVKPDFVGADVTQEDTIAGGILAGKSYSDIADKLSKKYDYKPVMGIERYEESK